MPWGDHGHILGGGVDYFSFLPLAAEPWMSLSDCLCLAAGGKPLSSVTPTDSRGDRHRRCALFTTDPSVCQPGSSPHRGRGGACRPTFATTHLPRERCCDFVLFFGFRVMPSVPRSGAGSWQFKRRSFAVKDMRTPDRSPFRGSRVWPRCRRFCGRAIRPSVLGIASSIQWMAVAGESRSSAFAVAGRKVHL